MTGGNEDRRKGGIKGDAARGARLAAELRRNLRRRKDRARALEAAKVSEPPDDEPAISDRA